VALEVAWLLPVVRALASFPSLPQAGQCKDSYCSPRADPARKYSKPDYEEYCGSFVHSLGCLKWSERRAAYSITVTEFPLSGGPGKLSANCSTGCHLPLALPAPWISMVT
jgi:hypothetical protein